MTVRVLVVVVIALFAAVLVAACGGGSDDRAPDGQVLVPPSPFAPGREFACVIPERASAAGGAVVLTVTGTQCGDAFAAGPGGGAATLGGPTVRLTLEARAQDAKGASPVCLPAVRTERGSRRSRTRGTARTPRSPAVRRTRAT